MFKNSLITDLALWLIARSRQETTLPELFSGFCGQLTDAGLDLWRVILGLETLHPELSGSLLLWQEGALEKVMTPRAGILTSDLYLRSPTRIVDETGRPFRWRAGDDTLGMPRLEAHAAEGVTDYLMLPLPFLDDTRTAVIGYATKASGGFSAGELDLLDAAARLLSPWAERAVLRRIAIGLLAAYLGPEAGRRVYDGQIERGDVRSIRAAIWFCDLRGFTAMSDRLPRAKLIKVLNRWFEVVGAAIAEGGGEILKFMGDGLLAVFPVDGDPASVCDRALAAAEVALGQTGALAEKLRASGEEPLRCGLALHLGDVEFGNIGTPTRLDFTVIGPAVNMASRLEGLTKELGCPVIASAEFATTLTRRLRPLGRHRLRGIAEPAAVYGLDAVQGLMASA
jgi:adenylate cyclase